MSSIQQAAYQRAQEKITAEAGALAENEAQWAKKISKELSEPGTKFADPTAASLGKVVKYGLANGATMSEYFSQVAADDAVRIESTIRQGVESGWTIDQMARNIAGTAENNYKDGIFETSRKSAVNMARTLTNSIANNAKEAFYRENQDVLEGVEILSTLDGRTCPTCAGLDRTRYKFDEPHPALPLHHQCRCVLLPVTPLSDLVEESRPMANADFMKEAERIYKAKYPNKDFYALADSTRKKYYYEAMRDYENRTGKPAYTQVSGGVSFRDYVENHMTAQQQKDWLGPQRYKLYKDHKLPLDRFIPPYPNKRMTIIELKEQDKASFAAAPAKPLFKSAKTIKEATEWTKQNRGVNVKWGKVDLESINIINDEMNSLAHEYPILNKMYETVGANGRMKACAWAHDSLIEFNPSYVNKDGLDGLLNDAKKRKSNLQNAIKKWENATWLSEKKRKNGIKKIHEQLKYDRYGAFLSASSPDECLRGIVTHETGHTILYRKAFEQQTSAGLRKNWRTLGQTESYKVVESAMQKAKATGDIYGISEYASSEMHEFFAETFVMYRFEKNKLPSYIIEMIEKVIK